MNIISITVSMFATNCYLVSCPETNETVIIDPGAEGKRIIEKIKALNLNVIYIINTHGHVDHIGANSILKETFKVPIMLSKKDIDLYNNPGFGLNLVLCKQPQPDHFIAEGDQITFGKLSLKVIETPGHTTGGICLLGDSVVFCGDTLFAGSIGRTDLAGGSTAALMKSIQERLLVLSPETAVFPGHGPETTIGAEAASNPFLSDFKS